MFLYIPTKQLERILTMVSEWKKDTDALIEKIAVGNGDDAETKAAVEQLKERVATAEARIVANDEKDEINLTEVHEAISAVVNKLQAGDTSGAISAATTAQGLVANLNTAPASEGEKEETGE